MDERKPYDPYGPNGPAPDTERKNRRASPYARPPAEEPPVSVRPEDEQGSPIDVWGNPVPPDRSYAQLTWDEEEYPESKPENLPKNARRPAGRTEAEAPEARETGGENPYIRPTWDESTYPDRKAGETGAAPERRGRAAALHFEIPNGMINRFRTSARCLPRVFRVLAPVCLRTILPKAVAN